MSEVLGCLLDYSNNSSNIHRMRKGERVENQRVALQHLAGPLAQSPGDLPTAHIPPFLLRLGGLGWPRVAGHDWQIRVTANPAGSWSERKKERVNNNDTGEKEARGGERADAGGKIHTKTHHLTPPSPCLLPGRTEGRCSAGKQGERHTSSEGRRTQHERHGSVIGAGMGCAAL